MVAITKELWRAALGKRLKDPTNTRFTTTDLDEAGQTAFPSVFPKFYKLVFSAEVTLDGNGFATPPAGTTASQVIDVEDFATLGLSIGYPGRRGNLIGPITAATSVVLVSYEPYDFPESGSEDVAPDSLELLYLHAMATLLKAELVGKTTYERYEPSNPDRVDENELIGVADTLMAEFERRLDNEVGMSLPTLTVV